MPSPRGAALTSHQREVTVAARGQVHPLLHYQHKEEEEDTPRPKGRSLGTGIKYKTKR